jgi:hypothetical protein
MTLDKAFQPISYKSLHVYKPASTLKDTLENRLKRRIY